MRKLLIMSELKTSVTHASDVETRPGRPKLAKPPMYRVFMLNDDFTPMDFVVDILIRFFHKSETEATKLMLQVHHEGKAQCGIFPRDIAESLVDKVETHSQANGHPLRCSIEKHGSD